MHFNWISITWFTKKIKTIWHNKSSQAPSSFLETSLSSVVLLFQAQRLQIFQHTALLCPHREWMLPNIPTRLRDTPRPAATQPERHGLQLSSTPPTRSSHEDHWRDRTQWTSGQRFPPGLPACSSTGSRTTKRRTSRWRIVDWRSLRMLEAGCLDADAAALTSGM